MIWSIDGVEWETPCQIARVAEITPSDISGVLLDRSYFNDVVGTYLSYSVKLAVPFNRMAEYREIYELLTEPVDGHIFVFPYNDDYVTITGRVASVNDNYVLLSDGNTYWKGCTFEVVANHPTKEISLSESVARGVTPLPTVLGFPDGTFATLVDGEWEFIMYDDADAKFY